MKNRGHGIWNGVFNYMSGLDFVNVKVETVSKIFIIDLPNTDPPNDIINRPIVFYLKGIYVI